MFLRIGDLQSARLRAGPVCLYQLLPINDLKNACGCPAYCLKLAVTTQNSSLIIIQGLLRLKIHLYCMTSLFTLLPYYWISTLQKNQFIRRLCLVYFWLARVATACVARVCRSLCQCHTHDYYLRRSHCFSRSPWK